MSEQNQTQAAPPTQKVEMKRQAATKLFVLYKSDGETGLTEFDFKTDLDAWLSKTNVTVLRIIRGVEKKIKTEQKVTLL